MCEAKALGRSLVEQSFKMSVSTDVSGHGNSMHHHRMVVCQRRNVRLHPTKVRIKPFRSMPCAYIAPADI